jgi:hypothetical protein
LKKHNNSRKKSEATSKRAKLRRPVPQDTKEVLAELVEKLRGKLDRKVAAGSPREREEHQRGELRPNVDRLTVGSGFGGPREPLLHFGSGERRPAVSEQSKRVCTARMIRTLQKLGYRVELSGNPA